MSGIVLDSSALLAHLKGEPAGEHVIGLLEDATISSVTLAETIGVLIRQGAAPENAVATMQELNFVVAELDHALAQQTGLLIGRTRSKGLSLADCACLALAARENLPVLTADRAWQDVQAGVTIQLIR